MTAFDWDSHDQGPTGNTRKQGSGSALWTMKWFPTEFPTRFRPDPNAKAYVDSQGRHAPWKITEKHFIQGIGYIDCEGPTCLVCAYGDPPSFGFPDMEPDEAMAKSRAGTFFSLAGWIEEWCHEVQHEKKKSQGTYTALEVCTGRGCEYCAQKIPRVFGRKAFAQFSFDQWKSIKATHDLLRQFCTCGGMLYTMDYVCPECGQVLSKVCSQCDCDSTDIVLHLDEEPAKAECQTCKESWMIYESDDPKLKEFASNRQTCQSCGKTNYPRKVQLCTTEGCAGEQHNLLSAQLTLKKLIDPKTEKSKGLQVMGYKIQPPDPRLFDPKFQGDNAAAAVIAQQNATSIDLDEATKTQGTAFQATRLNRPNLFAKSATASHADAYRKPTNESSGSDPQY